MVGSDAREMAAQVGAAPGGGTWDVGREQPAALSAGGVVGGVVPSVTVAPGADPGEVLAGCARILADARRVGSGYVGWWTDGDTGTLWLDVVDVVPVEQAGTLARERGELAFWDAGAGVEVRVA